MFAVADPGLRWGEGAKFLVMTLCLGSEAAKGLVLVHIFIRER